MYENPEVIIRFNNFEVQQAMAIWLDDDAQQAIRFVKEKIVDKTVQAECKRSALVRWRRASWDLITVLAAGLAESGEVDRQGEPG